jgi:hypothetical protein
LVDALGGGPHQWLGDEVGDEGAAIYVMTSEPDSLTTVLGTMFPMERVSFARIILVNLSDPAKPRVSHRQLWPVDVESPRA